MNHKKILAIFIVAFILNVLWENLHSQLYLHYQGGTITQLILLRATLFDAMFISILLFATEKIKFLTHHKIFWIATIAVISAILIEVYAISTNRWAYGPAMPLIPLLNVGLTPTIQLALLSIITHQVTKKM